MTWRRIVGLTGVAIALGAGHSWAVRAATFRTVVASSGEGAAAVDGEPGTAWTPRPGAGAWWAGELSAPIRGGAWVVWQATGFRYGNAEMAPVHYRWEASADSTDGRDGHWRVVGGTVDNGLRVRADRVQLAGEGWLRWRILAAGGETMAIREVTVRPDAARRDIWFMLGDSITDAAFNAAPCPTLVRTVQAKLPTVQPVILDGGTQGDNARQGLAQWQAAAGAIPAGCWVGIGFGTNDAAQRIPPDVVAAQIQTLIDQVRRSGRTPLLARIPFSPRLPLAPYLDGVDRLARRHGLMAGPDLFGWFRTHPEELQADQVHPTPAGRLSIQRLWGEAIVDALRRRWSLAFWPVGG